MIFLIIGGISAVVLIMAMTAKRRLTKKEEFHEACIRG